MKYSLHSASITAIIALSAVVFSMAVYADHHGKGNYTWIGGGQHGGKPMRDLHFGGPKGMMGGMMGGSMGLMRMAERLELTNEQRDSIGKIMDETQTKMRENGFALMDNRKDLKTLMEEEESSDRKLKSVTKKQGELMAEMMYLRLKSQSDIKAILNDEQREKMKKRPAFRRDHFRRDRNRSDNSDNGQNN